MSFRTAFQPTYDVIQRIAGPTGLDVRTNRIFAVVRTWDTGRVGLGEYSDERTEIYPRPRVKESNGGRSLEATPVSIALLPAELNPAATVGTEVLYEIEGPNAGMYQLESYLTARPFRATLVLRRYERRHPSPIG